MLSAARPWHFVCKSIIHTVPKLNLSIVSRRAPQVPSPECGSVLSGGACGNGLYVLFVSGTGPLPAVTETLTAVEDLQTASQVTGQVGDPHPSKTVYYITFPESL